MVLNISVLIIHTANCTPQTGKNCEHLKHFKWEC